jgi:hypothetical protein
MFRIIGSEIARFWNLQSEVLFNLSHEFSSQNSPLSSTLFHSPPFFIANILLYIFFPPLPSHQYSSSPLLLPSIKASFSSSPKNINNNNLFQKPQNVFSQLFLTLFNNNFSLNSLRTSQQEISFSFNLLPRSTIHHLPSYNVSFSVLLLFFLHFGFYNPNTRNFGSWISNSLNYGL